MNAKQTHVQLMVPLVSLWKEVFNASAQTAKVEKFYAKKVDDKLNLIVFICK